MISHPIKKKFSARLAVLKGCSASAITICLFANASAALAQSAQPSEYSSAVRYDGRGRVVGEIAPDPDGGGPNGFIAKRTSYDAAGLVVRVESGYLTSWQPSSVAPANWSGFTVLQTEHFAYDTLNQPVKSWVTGSDDATISMVQTNRDRAGREACKAVRMNSAAFASVPASACLLGAEGTQGPDRITRNHYNAAGELVRIQKAVGTPLVQDYASYTYTPNGKQQTVRDANGNLATFQYDGFDRQSRWIFPSKTAVGSSDYSDYEEYGYDANNNKTSHRKRDGSTITLQYDALNRQIAKLVPERGGLNSTHTRDVYFGYDNRDLQTYARFDGHGGEGITTNYDGFGRLINSTNNMDGISRTLTYEFDANGNRVKVTHPDGNHFLTTYDKANRATLIRENSSAWLRGYSYNQRGSLEGDSDGGGVVSTSFGYDNGGRVNSASRNLGGTSGDVSYNFSFNPASQIVRKVISNDSYAFAGRYNVNRGYAVNGLNQYVSAGSATFAYDANGNLTSDGSSNYQYDVENRLVSANGAVTALLRYDPLGRLYETGGSSAITRFLYDGDELVGEYDVYGNLLRRYVHGANVDDPVAWYEGASLANKRHLQSDYQGSVVSVTDASGNPIALNSYDEWGIPKGANTPGNTSDDNIGRFQYTGQAWIPELGMYHYKARIYSPTLGRFLQTDPIGYEDQVNLFAYAGNDPINVTDPEGNQRHPVRPPPAGPRISQAESLQARRAESAEARLRSVDPTYRDPGTLRAPRSESSRVAYSESYYREATNARIAIGMTGQSPVGGTIQTERLQITVGNATYVRTTASGPRFTRQYTGSGSGLDALRGLVGSNYTSEANGSYQARNVDIGNGLTANINLHRGSFGESGSGRSGYVMNIQINGANNPQVLNLKIEYPYQ